MLKHMTVKTKRFEDCLIFAVDMVNIQRCDTIFTAPIAFRHFDEMLSCFVAVPMAKVDDLPMPRASRQRLGSGSKIRTQVSGIKAPRATAAPSRKGSGALLVETDKVGTEARIRTEISRVWKPACYRYTTPMYHRKRRQRWSRRGGIEPPTNCLQGSCSATELRRRIFKRSSCMWLWSGRLDSNQRSPHSKCGRDGQTPPRPGWVAG